MFSRIEQVHKKYKRFWSDQDPVLFLIKVDICTDLSPFPSAPSAFKHSYLRPATTFRSVAAARHIGAEWGGRPGGSVTEGGADDLFF